VKKTKIICSIGPSSCNPDVMEQMVYSGMNVARINFSHATLEEKQGVVASVKEVRNRTGKNVAILYDTKGPEFRNGVVENGEITLEEGKTIRVVKENVIGNEERFSVNHPQALDSLEVGNTILLENGLMRIDVISKEEDGVTCKVINGGKLGDRKSLNAPGVTLDIPFISEQDKEDMIYACENDGDFIALSFVSSKNDVLEAKEIFKACNREDIKIISKIESKTGIDNLDEILEVSDGVMVARGDLGVEVPLHMLPIYQKRIVERARKFGKICVVATEMLESMKKSARPTRAEVSDVANAVLDGTDAVMLSGETTVGKYPTSTVAYMAQICENAEKFATCHFDYSMTDDISGAIAKSVVTSSETLNVEVIFAATMSGYTARQISNLRPKCDIIAGCPTEEVRRSLALNYGVTSILIKDCASIEEMVEVSVEESKKVKNLNTNDLVILTGGFPRNGENHTNLMRITKIN